MSCYKIIVPGNLPLYAQAASPQQAVKKWEAFCGPLDKPKVYEVKPEQIPEGETVL